MTVLTDMLMSAAWAASEGEAHAASITELFFPLINFLIFAFLVKRYGLPLIRQHLKQRRETLTEAVATAQQAKGEADGYIRKYQELLKVLDQEGDRIRESLRAEGERERTRIVAEAEQAAVKLKEDADFLADQEIKMARQQIRGEMALLAEAAAERVIQQHMAAADQDRMVENFSQQIQAL
jgi:F-type H+-transporting ATPase subunit b